MSQSETEDKVEQLLSVDDVARALSVSRRSVYRLVARGEIRGPVQVGKCSRFLASEVQAYVERLMAKRRDSRSREPQDQYEVMT